MDEGLNPTRRYKWFRPRQAAFITGSISGAANNSDVILYNNSRGPQTLVLRDLRVISGAGSEVFLSMQHGTVGTLLSTAVPKTMWPDQATPPGQIYTLDDATDLSSNFGLGCPNAGVPMWQHDFPFGIIPPNWSLIFQQSSALGLSILYEAVFSDELDYAFEL